MDRGINFVGADIIRPYKIDSPAAHLRRKTDFLETRPLFPLQNLESVLYYMMYLCVNLYSHKRGVFS